MSAETPTPAPDSTPAPQPEAATPSTAAAASDGAAPAGENGADFLADTKDSEAKPSTEGKADDVKADEAKADNDFLAETDDDEAADKSDAPGDEKPESAAEAYQPFTLPEGLVIDEDALAKATPILRKHGLDQDSAQELVSLQAEITQTAVQAHHQALADAHAQNLKDWSAQTKAHPEFGGKNLTAAKAQAAQALALEPGARKVLVEYGLDRHPAVFALLARVGSKLSPDSLVRDDAGAPDKVEPKRDADLFYN